MPSSTSGVTASSRPAIIVAVKLRLGIRLKLYKDDRVLLERAVTALEGIAYNVPLTLEHFMSELSDALSEATASLGAVIGDLGQSLNDALTAIDARIQALKDQLAADAADDTAVQAAVDALQGDLGPLRDMSDRLKAASQEDDNSVPPIV